MIKFYEPCCIISEIFRVSADRRKAGSFVKLSEPMATNRRDIAFKTCAQGHVSLSSWAALIWIRQSSKHNLCSRNKSKRWIRLRVYMVMVLLNICHINRLLVSENSSWEQDIFWILNLIPNNYKINPESHFKFWLIKSSFAVFAVKLKSN